MYFKSSLKNDALLAVTGVWQLHGGYMAVIFYIDEIYSRYLYTPVLKLADQIAYIDWEIYDKYFINGFGRVTDWLARITGRVDYEGIDQGVVDSFGRNTRRAGKMLRSVQTGKLQTYMLFALMGVIVIMVIQVI